ncbi:hypothetical protein ABH942_000767 [Flavobacterium sp. 28YEA47A]|uniref:hypothetical protein n=1 Tax=Flavobacterium sp. 28YEA47A TaxID=3156276 RepID=UPI0035115E1F
MKHYLYLLCICFFTLLVSCDKNVGETGVVEDAITGERLKGVVVKMNSSQGSRIDTTDIDGYFNVLKFFSCGIASCNTDYDIMFLKDGYDTLRISQGYSRSDNAVFVTEGKKDTLLIRLNVRD